MAVKCSDIKGRAGVLRSAQNDPIDIKSKPESTTPSYPKEWQDGPHAISRTRSMSARDLGFNVFLLVRALFIEARQRDFLKARQQQAGGNHRHEGDEPEHDAAAYGELARDVEWLAIEEIGLQNADHGQLRAADAAGQLHHRAEHAGTH